MVTLIVTFVAPPEVVSATTLTTGSLCSALMSRSRILRGWPGVGAGRGVSCAELASIEPSGLRWGVDKETLRGPEEASFFAGEGVRPKCVQARKWC